MWWLWCRHPFTVLKTIPSVTIGAHYTSDTLRESVLRIEWMRSLNWERKSERAKKSENQFQFPQKVRPTINYWQKTIPNGKRPHTKNIKCVKSRRCDYHKLLLSTDFSVRLSLIFDIGNVCPQRLWLIFRISNDPSELHRHYAGEQKEIYRFLFLFIWSFLCSICCLSCLLVDSVVN